MDEILAPILQGSPWAIVVVLGWIIKSFYLRLEIMHKRIEAIHKDYSITMGDVQDERRKEAVQMNDKYSKLAQGLGQSMELLTSAVKGLNGGRR